MNIGRVEQIGRPHEVYERPASPFVAGFLGKTNMLEGVLRREQGQIRADIGDGHWPAPDVGVDQVTVTVRPEKIGFGEANACSLGGQIHTRIFQGNHWLYQVDTPCGLVTVIRQNSGEPVPAEGDRVRLTWRPEDMSVRPTLQR